MTEYAFDDKPLTDVELQAVGFEALTSKDSKANVHLLIRIFYGQLRYLVKTCRIADETLDRMKQDADELHALMERTRKAE